MKAREQLAATIIAIGAGIVVLVLVWIVAWFGSRRGRYRLPFPRDIAGWVALIGGLIALVGVIITLTIYLTRRWGLQRVYTDTTILALFCTNREGEMIVYPMGFPPDELRYYVRLSLSESSSDEFECSVTLYRRLREGMRGRAVCRGNSLLGFYPDTGHSLGHNAGAQGK